MNKKIHLGIGHYGIGFQDGVNTVIARNVRALREIDPDLKITLFGKLSPDSQDFIKPIPGILEYLNIEEFNPEAASRKRVEKSIADQQVHDYVWQGTNLAEILVQKLADMDVILTENLGIGIDPTVTYAFFLYTQYCYEVGIKKKFIYRVHDFVQQRPHFFRNVKKFHEYRFGVVPNWHSVLYPASPNIKYIAINRYDRSRLIEHGIEEDNVFYIPNSVDSAMIPPDDRTDDLRAKIIHREGLDSSVRFILYPVRCVRRKNVEEAIFFTSLLNCLADGNTTKNNCLIEEKFHLLVSLKPESGDDARYTDQLLEFVGKHRLPVSIGFNDLVALERENDPRDPTKIERYGVGDMVRVADLVITTSVLEGFGFAYIEPWILDRAVIGRSIPLITPDFQLKGMKLGHLYTVLLVNGKDFKDIGKAKAAPEQALQEKLDTILRLAETDFVDRVIERNETPIRGTLRILDPDKRKKIIAINKKVVGKVYSPSAIGKQIYEVITAAQ
jgi:glycosyltransferase involved in cell wall biosynthesis